MVVTRSKSPKKGLEEAPSTPRTPRKSTSKKTPKSASAATPERKRGGSSAAPPFPGAGLLICVAVAIVSLLLFARGVGDVGEGVKVCKATSIQFPTEAFFGCCGNLQLAGVGVRKKANIIPVYSVGMYTKGPGLSGGSAKALLGASAPKAARLTFALITGVKAADAAQALRDGVAKVGGVEESAMNKFQALLESGIGAEKMKKGDSMTLEWGGGGKAVEVTVRGKKVGKIADASLAKGLLRLYLDEKNTVSPALIKDIGSS